MMITQQQLAIFYRYNGDGDGFAKMGNENDYALFGNNGWALISDLVWDLTLIYTEKVSEDFKNRTELKLKQHCDSLATIESLHKYAAEQKD